MKPRTRELFYAALVLGLLILLLALAYSTRDTSFSRFPHQVEKARPGGVLPRPK